MKPSRYKFRCWNPHIKQMETMENSSMPHLWADGTLHIEYDCIDVTDNLVLMMSTGLIDSKGVEIFEGDILQYDDPWGNKNVMQVTWGYYQWYLPLCCPKPRPVPFANNVIVIGNVYENPELLEAK